MAIRIRLAGDMQVETESGLLRAADFPGRQGRLVFARLALAPHPVSRDELADLVWTDRLPKSWERDLSAVCSKIRSLLVAIGIEEPLQNAFGCYRLRLDVETHVDVDQAKQFVEEAETALRKGDLTTAHASADVAANHTQRPLLPGEDGEWITGLRAEWAELRRRALLLLVDVHVQRRILPEARRYAHELIDLDRYDEAAHAALIRVLVASGERAGALKVYERARAMLIDEMGVPPSTVLESAHQEALLADADILAPAGPLPAGTVSLLFTDIVGSVALCERLGPNASDQVRILHFELLRSCIASHGGYEVKNLGDGLMVAFPSSGAAVDAAIAMQRALRDDNATVREPIEIRIGIHVGEPTIENDDYFGRPVAIARRLCDAAAPGGVLVTDLVANLSRAPEQFVDRNAIVLKGMTIPTTVWSVDPRVLNGD